MVVQPENICSAIKESLVQSGLFSLQANGKGAENTWRISPEPYYLSPAEVRFFAELGGHLLKFYSALNRFYLDSAKGKLPGWFAEYLDIGKPADLVSYGRMNRFKRDLPGIIRPDVIVREDGFVVTELDSVPGGFGLTARLMSLYRTSDNEIVGLDEGGIPELFYRMVKSVAGIKECTLAIVVSDESQDYRAEMDFLGTELKTKGFSAYVVHPSEIVFKEEGLYVVDGNREVRLDAVYRFFELFDLLNIPKSELLGYSNKKGRVKITPPYKAYLEEKLSFALFHHPSWTPLWEKALGAETFAVLSHLIPKTWTLDNRELPPHGIIPGLEVKGATVRDWKELFGLTQKEREMVVKPSGFSPNAWGSRGVVMGHDVSAKEWSETLENGLRDFPQRPSVLQKFHKGKRVSASYFSPSTQSLEKVECRVRLTPYYFVVEESARLGGILATLCPHDKKKIHGMADAIMVPCAVRGS